MQTSHGGGIFKEGLLIAERYELLNIVGTGGMGKVVRVIDRALDNEIIALKLLSAEMAHDPVQFARFRNEVLLTRKLAHPNIVRIYDFGSAGEGYYFISMEYVPGGSLGQKIYYSEEKLSFSECLRILCEICLGLSCAHRQGIVHRDLKPDNVLLGELNEVKITDFGLARTMKVDKGFTETGQTVGTPYYMAPEQLRGERTDGRTDIYSLGIMAFEMVVGRRPFCEENYLKLVRMHHEDPIPDFATKESGIPLWFQELVQRCAEKRKEDRFKNIDEVYAELISHLNDRQNQTVQRLPILFSFYAPIKKLRHRRSFWRATARNLLRICVLALLSFLLIYFTRQSEFLRLPVERQVVRLERVLNCNLSALKQAIGSQLSNESFTAYILAEDTLRLEQLLAAGVSANKLDQNSEAALIVAIVSNHQQAAKLLLNYGADAKVKTKEGIPALLLAAQLGQKETVQKLLEKGADPFTRDANGMNVLLEAAVNGHLDVVQMLIDRGYPTDLRDNYGMTALTHAVIKKQKNIANVLLNGRANADIKDMEGNTALHYAARAGDQELIRMLISSGADPMISNSQGKTAQDIASRANRSLMQKVVKSPSADQQSANFSALKIGQQPDNRLSNDTNSLRTPYLKLAGSIEIVPDPTTSNYVSELRAKVRNAGVGDALSVEVKIQTADGSYISLEGVSELKAGESASYFRLLDRPKLTLESCKALRLDLRCANC